MGEEAIESASVVIGLKVPVPPEVEGAERGPMDLADQTAQIEEATVRRDLTAPEVNTLTEVHLQDLEAAEEEVQAKAADTEVTVETLEM